MKRYSISEIFYSVQGEGYWVGTPAVFIRLAGCNLNCSFFFFFFTCKETLGAAAILANVEKLGHGSKRVILTGGEPLLQIQKNKDPLLQQLRSAGYRIHLETNGTLPLPIKPVYPFYWVTVSPKEDMVLTQGDELKVVYTDTVALKEYEQFDFTHRYLQPCWDATSNSCNVNETVNLVKENPQWKLSLQMHKFIGIA